MLSPSVQINLKDTPYFNLTLFLIFFSRSGEKTYTEMFLKLLLEKLDRSVDNFENMMSEIGKGRNPGTSSLSSLDPSSDPITNILAGR